MKVKVTHDFYDRKNDLKLVKAGDELTVTKERAEELEGLNLVSRIREPIKVKPTEA